MSPVLMPMLAAVLIAQSPAETKAEALAGLYGETLGAASECPALSQERLAAVAQKASARVKSTARNPAEADAAGTRLADGIARGRREIVSGRETCAQAESELDDLGHELGPE